MLAFIPTAARTRNAGAVLLTAWLLAAGTLGALPASAAEPTFRIVSPAQDETVHDNAGTVQVELELPPALSGARIVLLLDGREVASGHASTFTLDGVDRGSHTLVARAHPVASGAAVESPPVTFDVFQASQLFPSRQ